MLLNYLPVKKLPFHPVEINLHFYLRGTIFDNAIVPNLRRKDKRLFM